MSHVLVYWTDDKTTSIVGRSHVKARNISRSTKTQAKYGPKMYPCIVVDIGDESTLSKVVVNRDTGEILNGPAVTSKIATARKALQEENSLKSASMAASRHHLSEALLNTPSVVDAASSASSNNEQQEADPDSPTLSDAENEQVEQDSLSSGAELGSTCQDKKLSQDELLTLFQPLFDAVNDSNVEFLYTVARTLNAVGEYKQQKNLGNSSFSCPSVSMQSTPAMSQAKSSPNLPCYDATAKGMRELVPGHNVFINKYKKGAILTRVRNNTKALMRELFAELVGEANLRTMSAKGVKSWPAVPKTIYDAVSVFIGEWRKEYIKANPNEEEPELMTRKMFNHTLNAYINRLRDEVKTPEERAMSKEKAAKRKRDEDEDQSENQRMSTSPRKSPKTPKTSNTSGKSLKKNSVRKPLKSNRAGNSPKPKTPERSPVKTKTSRKSPKDRTPEKAPKERTPGKSPKQRTPGKSPNQRTPGKSPNQRTPGKSPNQRTPGKSPNQRTPGKSPNQKTPGKSPKPRTPGKSPKQRTPGKSPFEAAEKKAAPRVATRQSPRINRKPPTEPEKSFERLGLGPLQGYQQPAPFGYQQQPVTYQPPALLHGYQQPAPGYHSSYHHQLPGYQNHQYPQHLHQGYQHSPHQYPQGYQQPAPNGYQQPPMAEYQEPAPQSYQQPPPSFQQQQELLSPEHIEPLSGLLSTLN